MIPDISLGFWIQFITSLNLQDFFRHKYNYSLVYFLLIDYLRL